METTTTCYFFVPGLSEKYRSGGLMVARDVAQMIGEIPGYESKFVATHEENDEALTPGAAFAEVAKNSHPSVFFVTWGPLVAQHIKLIQNNVKNPHIIYYAQSFGWDIKIPAQIPIVCVSRYVMAQWALHATENFCTYVPPPLHSQFTLENSDRDIDVLVHKRKQNAYCLEELLPALKNEKLNVQVLDEWISQEDFAALLNRTKIFLYVTALHKAGWGKRLPGEGFGLPALEALVCGTVVGSNLLGGVTDFLTPGENCLKLQNGDLNFDIHQIKKTLQSFEVNEDAALETAARYSKSAVLEKWEQTLRALGTC